MKRILLVVFLWSWTITLPISVLGGYVAYDALSRFLTFSMRYGAGSLTLSVAANYTLGILTQSARVGLEQSNTKLTQFRTVNLFVPEANLAVLESHLPQSGFEYVKGLIINDGRLVKAKFRYRGDFGYHWLWDKKSIRVKVDKDRLFEGIRTFNLLAPKQREQLNSYLGLMLAEQLGLIAPKTELVNVNLNRKSYGIHVFVEQLKEETLRRKHLMPGDVYRGELAGKDAFVDSGAGNLFDSAALWDKVAVNNHYAEEAMAPLAHLLELIRDQDSESGQAALAEYLDIDAWARFSAFETLAQTKRYDRRHNWRLYYDPWRKKVVPIVWDPLGWPLGLRPKAGKNAVDEVVITPLHAALFKNGDFLRARSRVLQDYFGDQKDVEFLQLVTNTIALMNHAIPGDRLLKPTDYGRVSQEMQALETTIRRVFADTKNVAWAAIEEVDWSREDGAINVATSSKRPLHRIRIETLENQAFVGVPTASVYSQSADGQRRHDVSGGVTLSNQAIELDVGLLADLEPALRPSGRPFANDLIALPARYRLEVAGLDSSQITRFLVDLGEGWKPVEESASLDVSAMLGHAERVTLDNQSKLHWRMFWNTGSGFNRREATPVKALSRTPNSDRLSLRHRLPANIQMLRVDLPSNVPMLLTDIRLKINKSEFEIPLSDLNLKAMQPSGQGIVPTGNGRPFFHFDVTDYVSEYSGRRPVQVSFDLDYQDAWETRVAESQTGTVARVHQPVASHQVAQALIWSGDVTISGTKTIDQPLVLRPGTRLLMEEQATLVVEGRLLAQGTADEPIEIIPASNASEPWGALVLLGPQAGGSALDHCKVSGGSGAKHDLHEYTAMLSIHDVDDVLIRNCAFRDSKITDDMLHTVYSNVRIENSSFVNAPADAVDLDISNVTIVDSLFEANGNDGLDLMTSDAEIIRSTFKRNGDKGISVGEGSNVVAIDNRLLENEIGVQVKDASIAALVNHSFEGNKKALDAYKKNWRYGEGGTIAASKAKIVGSQSVVAGKRSKIYLFDSYWDAPTTSKNMVVKSVDSSEAATATHKDLWPPQQTESNSVDQLFEDLSPELLAYIRPGKRGAHASQN